MARAWCRPRVPSVDSHALNWFDLFLPHCPRSAPRLGTTAFPLTSLSLASLFLQSFSFPCHRGKPLSPVITEISQPNLTILLF